MKFLFLNLLDEIEQERRSRRRPVPMQLAASPVALSSLQELAIAKLGYTVPAAYIELLALVDGIDSNGIILYASHSQPLAGHPDKPDYTIEGFVEANELWRAGEEGAYNRDYVYFAESGDYLYCHYLPANQYRIVDRVTLEPIYEPAVFDTAEGLLEQVLNHMLNRYGVEDEGVEE